MRGFKWVPGLPGCVGSYVWQDDFLRQYTMHNAFTPDAEAFRFYEDGSESAAVQIAAQGTGIGRDVTSGNATFQLRIQTGETGLDSSGNNVVYTLEYEINNSGTWVLVTATSAAIRVDAASSLTDGGSANSDRLTGGTGTDDNTGLQEAGDGATGAITLSAGNNFEAVWGLEVVKAGVADADLIDFRVLADGTTTAATMGQPRITVTETASVAADFDKYRFYADGTEAGAVAAAAEDTFVARDDKDATDKLIHLRVRLQNTAATAGLTTDDWGLEYEKNQSASWAAVTATSSGVKSHAASGLSDGVASTQRLAAGTGSYVAGEQEEVNGVVENHQLTASNFTEHVFALEFVEADNTDGDEFRFRITLNGSPTVNMTNTIEPAAYIARPPVLRQVERVPVSFIGTDNTKTATLATTLLDISRAFIFFGVSSNSTDQEDNLVQGRIISTTQVQFDRFDATGVDAACEIIAYVCEFTEGVRVDRGNRTIDATSISENLTNVYDIAKSFISTSLRAPGTAWGTDEASMSELVAGTPNQIKLTIDAVGGTNNVLSWEVIQYNACTVQRGTAPTMADGTGSVTQAVTAVDLAKTMLRCSFWCSTAADAGGQYMIRGRFTSDIQLTFDRGATAGVIEAISWEAIEFTDNTVVEAVSEDFIATDGQEDATITAVSALTKAMAVASVQGGWGRQDWTTTNIMGESSFTADLTSTTNLQTKRDATNDAAAAEFYVVDFGALAGGFVDIDSAISQSLAVNSAPNLLSAIDASISQSLSVAARQNVLRPLDALLSSSVSISAIIGANFPIDSQVNMSLAVAGEISRLASLFSQIDMSLAVSGEIDKLIGLYSDLAMSLAVSGALNAPINLDGLISQALSIGAEASRLRSLNALSASALTLAARLNDLIGLNSEIIQGFVGAVVAPVFIADADSWEGSNVSTHTIDFPAGISVGDLLVAPIVVDNDLGVTITKPTGWAEEHNSSDNPSVGTALWWKIADSGDVSAGNTTFETSAIEQSVHNCLSYDAGTFNAADPIHAFATATGTSASPVAPEVTTTIDKCQIIGWISAQGPSEGSDVNATPSGWTLNLNQQSAVSGTHSCCGISFRKVQTVAGATGDATSGLASSRFYRGIQVAIEPASSSGGDIAGELNVIRPLSSSIDTTLSLAGELGPIRGLNSDISSSLDIQAELGPLRGLAATVPAALSMGAALGATFDFNSLISQSLVIGSELDVVPAGAVFVDFDGSLSQSLTLGSSLNIIRPVYASIDQSLTLGSSLNIIRPVYASIDQSLTVNADVNLLKNLVSQIVTGLSVAGELSTAATIDLASQIALALSLSSRIDAQPGFSAVIQSSLLTSADLNVLKSFSANFNFQSGVNARLGAVFDISGSIDSSLVFDGTLSCFIGLSGDVQCSLLISGSRENLAGLFGSVDFILTSQGGASCIVGMWGSIDQAMSLIGELEGVSDIVYEIGRSSVRIIQRGGNSSSRIAKGGGITSGTE